MTTHHSLNRRTMWVGGLVLWAWAAANAGVAGSIARSEFESGVSVVYLPVVSNGNAPPSDQLPDLAAIGLDKAVQLVWQPLMKFDVQVYRVYYALEASGPFSLWSLVAHPESEYVVDGLFNGHEYYFYVVAIGTDGQEIARSATVSSQPRPLERTRFQLLHGLAGAAQLAWQIGEVAGFTSAQVWLSSTTADGPYVLLGEFADRQRTLMLDDLENGRAYYLRLEGVYPDGSTELRDTGLVIPNVALGFGESRNYYFVRFNVGDKPVQYTFNRETRAGADGQYQQFAPEITFGGVPISAPPYGSGLPGLSLLSFEAGNNIFPPRFGGEAELISPEAIVLRYVSLEDRGRYPAGSTVVRMAFSADRPFLEIDVAVDVSGDCFSLSWNVFSAIGGRYNPASRVVVPFDPRTYYVINGQAVGLHYFARSRFWGLRMGAEGTPYADITTGFFAATGPAMTLYPQANDYLPGLFDTAPYELDRVWDGLFVNYQEDEAGEGREHGYAWQNADMPYYCPAGDTAPLAYIAQLYYWVGEDHWRGEYGLGHEDDFMFEIARYQRALGEQP